MRKHRFFFHYYKQKGKMSVHFKGVCSVVEQIECEVPCETKWNKTQPKLVMRGYASSVEIKQDKAYIR